MRRSDWVRNKGHKIRAPKTLYSLQAQAKLTTTEIARTNKENLLLFRERPGARDGRIGRLFSNRDGRDILHLLGNERKAYILG